MSKRNIDFPPEFVIKKLEIFPVIRTRTYFFSFERQYQRNTLNIYNLQNIGGVGGTIHASIQKGYCAQGAHCR